MTAGAAGLADCVKMRMRVAEDEFEVSGSTPSPRTFAPHKSRLNKLHQVSSVVILVVFATARASVLLYF